jgi:23S rRNA (cytosine1962-C5)-methyltransferase
MHTLNIGKGYELLDIGDGERLENWNGYLIVRPDIHVKGEKLNIDEWDHPNALFSDRDKEWQINNLPEKWLVKFEDLKFWIKPMSNKQMGLFPEQDENWQWIINKSEKEKVKTEKNKKRHMLLNLFGYTGGATIASVKAGFHVTHVDSNQAALRLTKDNMILNNLELDNLRIIHEDVMKFIKKEVKRGSVYDSIIMDPPAFGRGAKNEIWSINKNMKELLELTKEMFSDKPAFFILNSYTDSLDLNMLKNMIEDTVGKVFRNMDIENIGLKTSNGSKTLDCGITIRLY